MFDNIKKMLDNKNILILGYGKEGRSTLSFIKENISPCSLAVADKSPISDLPDGVESRCGDEYLACLYDYDVIIKSPGIALPSRYEKIKSKITSQSELFLMEFRNSTIGITGTKGKSTTTTLIHHILKSVGIDAVLTGNIGIPPLDSARMMKKDSVAVFEMSCHQLEIQRASPRVAVIINLYEDHLDHYGTRERYIAAKENIFLNQSENDILIINAECKEQISKAPSRVITETGKTTFNIPKDSISLIGEHNYFNIEIAKKVTDLFGVSEKLFIDALSAYSPLPHRLEYFATKNGVDYYDDSISTVCQTTINAIVSLENVETVIIGGMDRGIDYTELVDFFEKRPLKNIILAYASGKRISEMLEKRNIKYILTDDLTSAVGIAAEITPKGSKCVLSPAAASYGYFKNFEERGEAFKKLVNSL